MIVLIPRLWGKIRDCIFSAGMFSLAFHVAQGWLKYYGVLYLKFQIIIYIRRV